MSEHMFHPLDRGRVSSHGLAGEVAPRRLTMKLNHLDLQVADVQQHVDFFEELFELRLQSSRTSPAIAFLDDGHGFVLVLQRKVDPPASYPEDFHLGFLVDDVATVHRFHDRARSAGVDISDVITNNRGTMVYCRAPAGFLVEVSCRTRGPGVHAS
jgi:catechol 2,3-dioxygenase-like lactoylglutathione lyase family enzyme